MQMEVEIGRLDRRYAGLRVLDVERLGALMASLASSGQQSPVLVVAAEGDARAHGVLIDGYRRVLALEKLGRDTVVALALETDAAEALLMRHRLAAAERRSALEDGWLVRELQDAHGLSLNALAVRLSRSVSWVSRRAGLVRDLPESIQDLVRRGDVTPYAAMKYLLPLARANAGAVDALALSLRDGRWTSREIGDLYVGWRKADAEERARIVESPDLYCRALEEVAPHRPLPGADTEGGELAAALRRLSTACRTVSIRLASRRRTRKALGEVLVALYNDADQQMTALRRAFVEALEHA